MRINDFTLNRLKVLKAIRRHAPIARSDLTGITGLSGGSITQLTRDLVDRGLVVEKKQEARRVGGRTGRRRIDLAINAAGGIVLGASVGGPSGLTMSFVDLGGQNLFTIGRAPIRARSLVAFAHEIARHLHEAIAASPFAPEQISRVGIALPAIVDNRRGLVHSMVAVGSGRVPFAEIIAGDLGLPVTIEHDMVCMARAEHWFGRARDLDDFTLIEVGYQVGSSEYQHGLPRFGANGLTSEIGHTKVTTRHDALPCHCGGIDCVTTYSSMFGILQRIGWLDLSTLRSLEQIDDLFVRFLDLADHGDSLALSLLEDAALHLATALANRLNDHDPGNVLVLVPNPRFKNILAGRVPELMKSKCIPGVFAGTNIMFDTSNEDWRWKGTAALALEKTYLEMDFSSGEPSASRPMAAISTANEQ